MQVLHEHISYTLKGCTDGFLQINVVKSALPFSVVPFIWRAIKGISMIKYLISKR